VIEQVNKAPAGIGPAVVRRAAAIGKGEPGRPVVRRDGETIVIDIPLTFRRRGKRKEIVLPPGVTTGAPPRPPSPLALAVVRALRWQEMIESGEAESVSDLARRLKLDRSFVARTLRLASLAPDIIETILEGQEPDGLPLRSLRQHDISLLWEEQRGQLDIGPQPHAAMPTPEKT